DPFLDAHAARDFGLDPGQTCGVPLTVDRFGPHDQGVLVGLDVIVFADAGRVKAKLPVHRLSARVAYSHLEWEIPGAPLDGFTSQVEQQPGADLVAVPGRVNRDGRDVGILAGDHQTGVADHHAADPRHVVGPAVAQVE